MTIALNIGNVGGIDDYSALVDAIKLWLDRGSELDTQIPTFIGLIEPYLNRRLRTPDMDATAFPMVSNGTVMLPDDCLEVRGISYRGHPLNATSPGQLMRDYGGPSGILPGFPVAYAISGRTITLAPSSAASTVPQTAMLSYWQRIPSLTLSAPTNWLLTAHPDVYLYGALAQAEGYIENPERAAQWTGLFEASVESLAESASRSRYGGPIVARAMRQVAGVRA